MCKTIQDPVLRSPFDLTGELPTELLQSYFEYVRAVRKKGYSFPVNLDDVWPICYTRKSHAVSELKEHFYEDIDYIVVKVGQNAQSADNQILPKNRQNEDNFAEKSAKFENQQVSDENECNSSAGRKPVTYYLSLSGLEHLIVRRRREVFEVYRRVFHAALDYAEQSARQQATEIRESPVEIRPDGRRIFLDYRLFSHKFYLMQSTADFEIHSYCKELIGRLQEGYNFPVDANEVYTLLGFVSSAQLTTYMKGGNAKTPNPNSPYQQGDDYNCYKRCEDGRYTPSTFRSISIGAFGRLMKDFNTPLRFLHIYHQYFPQDNMRPDEVLSLYPIGLTLSQSTADPAVCLDEAMHMAQLEMDMDNRMAFGLGKTPKTMQPDHTPQPQVVTPVAAQMPRQDCCPSFARLFQSIMSMRGKVTDTQIVESLYDLQRLASL